MSGIVRIVEVGPRDGLQNEKTPISVADRIAFIEALLGAGLRTVEVGAFVSPKAIPQMVNSDAVLRGVSHHGDCEFPVLVPNEKGYEASRQGGARLIAVFAAASESFSRANINCSVAESIERFKPVLARARVDGVRVRGYVSCVLGCPYEGEIKPQAVVDVARVLWDLGCYEVSLGDTIGVGTPMKARHLLRAVAGTVPMDKLAMHFHDTYGQALANLYAGMEEGCRVIDSAAGGLGGCPYAPGATGNVATEDVVYMLKGMGIETGVDMAKLVAATNTVSQSIDRAHAGQPCGVGAQRQAGCEIALPSPVRSHHQIGQTRRDSREEAQQQHRQHHQEHEWQRAPDYLAQGDVGRDVTDHEDVQSDRRVDQSHLHHDRHDDAEPDDVEIGSAQRRQDDRRGHQDDRHRRQEEAEHDDHDEDRGQQFPARQVHRDDGLGRRLRDVQIAHYIGIEQRHADDHHQHGGILDGRFQDRREVARPPDTIDQRDQDQSQ
jgi:hydroxymethylglutaryl-CoA lyase